MFLFVLFRITNYDDNRCRPWLTKPLSLVRNIACAVTDNWLMLSSLPGSHDVLCDLSPLCGNYCSLGSGEQFMECASLTPNCILVSSGVSTIMSDDFEEVGEPH
jgi:hypothetical protein